MIVATLTMSMGMMMMPPTVISLPFKMLFFVLIDGWNLLVSGLVRSFSSGCHCRGGSPVCRSFIVTGPQTRGRFIVAKCGPALS